MSLSVYRTDRWLEDEMKVNILWDEGENSMGQIIYQGQIDSDFKGFDEDEIFKMSNGTYWVQAQYRYWYHYEYRPNVTITREAGRYILSVAGESIEVRQLYDVIESNIDGTFKGWEGNTTYKLTNGQIWKQKVYKYEYKYAYRPEVIIAEVNGVYVMQVEESRAEVVRIR